MGYPGDLKDLPALKSAVRKLESHDSNPAMPQLRKVLLKRIADLEESKREQRESRN